MTKFEDKLEKLPIKTIQHPFGDTEYYKAVHIKTLIAQADEEFQELKEQHGNQAESILLMLEEISTLKSQLQQQALPVVPEFVAKDVKRLSLSTLADWNVAVFYISKETLEWLSTTGNINVFLGKSWTLCSLKINGFKVEKPQIFYLKNKLTGDCLAMCLARASSGLYVEVTEKWLTRKEQTSYKLYFTQQEIDSMETGSYEQIEVAE